MTMRDWRRRKAAGDMVVGMNSFSDSYKAAGVDVTAGYKAVELMKSHVARTKIPGVLSGIGGFGGLFEPDLSGVKNPVLVSGTDGVGTKLKIAFLLDKHDTVGIDCVAMCVNDVVCCGAKPLFFLDYIAVGRNVPERVAAIVSGVAEGCVQAGCALIGVSSSGVHSNGFSLVRKIFHVGEQNLNLHVEELGKTLGEELLTPTKIYVKPLLKLMEACDVHAVSHITGGGFYENIPRMLRPGQMARIEKAAVPVLPIFHVLQRTGGVPERDMFNTFNMGVGLCIALPAGEADKAVSVLKEAGENACVLGEVKDGEGVELC